MREYVVPGAFAEFYGIAEQAVKKELGEEGWRQMPVSDVPGFVNALERVLAGGPTPEDRM